MLKIIRVMRIGESHREAHSKNPITIIFLNKSNLLLSSCRQDQDSPPDSASKEMESEMSIEAQSGGK